MSEERTGLRRWLGRRRSSLATIGIGTVLLAVVAGASVASNGYPAQRMELGDGSVWVVNAGAQAVGRANPEVLELDTVVRSSGADLEIVQRGTTVLVVDHGEATVSPVDPATGRRGEATALPPDDSHLLLAGDRVVVHARGTGEVWILALGELEQFDGSATPNLSLGVDSLLTAGPDGEVFAYLPDADEVFRIDATGGKQVVERWTTGLGDIREAQLTSVGGRWAVLDVDGRRIATDAGIVDLGGVVPVGADQRLQEPGPASSRVLLGTDFGLVAAPLDGGDPSILVGDAAGAPAAPFVAAGCVHAAWATGTAWRDCGEEVRWQLAGATAGAALDYAENTGRIVLNDVRRGATWAVQEDAELIDNWEELLVDAEDEQEEQNDPDVPPTIDEEQKPPVAVDDEFGARPGRATVLPVLLNDYDPNADVLVIEQVDVLDEAIGRLDLVTRNQQLQLTLDPDASGVITFRYTIGDGRGGTASATVTVTVRGEHENSPPQQVRTTRSAVAEGGRVDVNVIGDWIDPDGDPFYLASAATAQPDQATHKPDGMVVFADAGGGGDVKSVSLVMSDGRDEGTGSLLLEVAPPGELPIVVEPWVVIATAGEEVTVRPLNHVRGGVGEIRLNAVPERAGSTIRPSFEAGTFTFSSGEVRTHYVEFTVTDGDQTASGLVRVDVVAPADANTRPITVPKTLFVTTLSDATIDPTQTDIDPAGGVLVVTGIEDPGGVPGVRAEVLAQRDVRVTLTQPLEGRTVTIRYRISNGLADAIGTITVVEIPEPTRLQPPVATEDTATVRVGDVVDIPVLDNDEHPDGKPIELVAELADEPSDGAGLLFTAGDRLRYLAPDIAGDFTAVYSITGPDGQRADARVTISVREVNTATNSAPVPRRVTARVLAGETVTIPIPLSGIDPDGDSVQLIGVSSNPEKGAVVSVGANTIEFEAGEYSSGTDEFGYTVVDGLGARAEGTIRVGISPRLDGARNPVANEDAVSVRPGRTVSVQVLANDSDPDGSPLRVVSAAPNSDGLVVDVVDDAVLDITPPEEPGSYGVSYTIQNEFGGTSTAFVTVTVDPEAPLARPVAGDTVLTASDVVDADVVDADVLDNVFWADGDVADLAIRLLPEYADGAELLPDKRIRVEVGDVSRIIPFAVAHPEDPALSSLAFLWVPGYEDTLPQLDRTAPPLRIASEETLRIELDDYVVSLRGDGVRLTDSSTVRATRSNGDDLVVDEDTLEFTSADQYFGPASITFEVTDGATATDPEGRRAILTLPIDVLPRENQPPVFVGGVVDFEPGQSKELDLVRLTDYPYDDIDELAYTVLEPLPEGFRFELNGQRLVLTAEESTPKGTRTAITLGVRDDLNEGRAGRIVLNVVPSTRPLADPVPDRAVTPRGTTTTIDVLANDVATNPFPGEPLTVVTIRGLEGAAIPPGVSIEPSADRSRLLVTVGEAAEPIDTTLQYQVADATRDPDRHVWGTVTISIQDVPDPVSAIQVTEFGDRSLKLSWTPGQFNNSPITGYEVAVTNAATGDAIGTTTCQATVDCAITTPGNGPGNAVRIQVVAINGIGRSDPAALAGQIWSDIIPPPPGITRVWGVDQGLGVEWTKPAAPGGSPIERYLVTVGDAVRVVEVNPADPVGTAYRTVLTSASLANGSVVGVAVSARNSAPNSLATWNQATASGIPAGPPTLAGPAVSASGSITDGTTANASWSGVFGANGAPITRYWAVIRSDGSVPTCTVSGVEQGNPSTSPPTGPGVVATGTGTSANWGGLAPNQTYTIFVFAANGHGCTMAPPVQVTPRATPGTITAIDATSPISTDADGEFWDIRLDGITIGSGSTDADTVIFRLSGGSTVVESSGIVGLPTLLQSGASHYGNQVAVELRACKAYPEATLCGPWSAPFALGVPVRNTTPGGLEFDGTVLGGTWNWTSAPTGDYTAVEYRCTGGAPDAGWQPMPAVGDCSTGLLGGDLQVRITANGTSYVRSYDWSDF